jgi:LSD1 subclass zinc finger protein
MWDTVTRVLECPNCGAPLAPPRFARSVVCSFCQSTVQVDPSAVSAAPFREALAAWNSPETHGYTNFVSIGQGHWATRRFIARGEISDAYLAERARWPTERVLLKILREPEDAPLFDREWEVLNTLQRSEAPGAALFTTLLPQPVVRGLVEDGTCRGRRAMAFRWATGFRETLEGVRRAYPRGIDPQVSIWMWRRILELLTFLHRSGVVHGAVVPPHILVEDGEHGIRLVGYSAAGASGTPLATQCGRFEPFYSARRLSPGADVAMSARSIAYVLGAGGAGTDVPASVPEPLADLIRRVASDGAEDAWDLRESVGKVARTLYGPPSFHPLMMPP